MWLIETISYFLISSGGSSYASYENIVTKSRIVESETVVNIASSIDLTISAGTSFEGDLCSGGGMGAIVLFCTVSIFVSKRIANDLYKVLKLIFTFKNRE